MSADAYAISNLDGQNPTLTNPISPTGDAMPSERYEIPARQGRAVRMKRGDSLTIFNPSGHQVCDFFAITQSSPHEFLSMEHCRTAFDRVYVRQGDVLVTNRRRPLIEIVRDESPGVHDILVACCDGPRYEQLGATGYHDNCADNFKMSLQAIGVPFTHVPSPFNIWMNIPVAQDGTFRWDPPVAAAESYVVLKAHEDCIAIMSACPEAV